MKCDPQEERDTYMETDREKRERVRESERDRE